MPQPPGPARRRILEVLADGRWHLVEDVLSAAGGAVSPGQAWRAGEANRTRMNPGPRHRGDDDTSIAAGRRAIATKALGALIRQGRVVRRGHEVRLP